MAHVAWARGGEADVLDKLPGGMGQAGGTNAPEVGWKVAHGCLEGGVCI